MSNAKNTGISLTTLLFLVFLTLKLAEVGQVATWSWWWVTSPLWIPFAIVAVVFAIVGFFMVLALIGGAKFTITKKENKGPEKTSAFQQRLEAVMKKRRENSND